MESFLKIERDGAVVTATFNRPDDRNAITEREQSLEIVDFCAAMRDDVSVKAIILTGAGKAFCAGGNVKHMRDRAGMFAGTPYQLRNTYRTSVQLIGPALYELEVPIIAAINGPAIGLGLDISCMCDIRIMAQTAVAAESYVKLGIIPGGGGAWILPRVIGLARASQLTLTGDTIDAETALAYGLVSEVLPGDALLPRARAIAASIAGNPGHATRLAKRLMREGQSASLRSLLDTAAAFQALSHYTDDHIEAVSALLDKRDPIFRQS
jgi:enoyl-CoA hydratase/carnithine racemase